MPIDLDDPEMDGYHPIDEFLESDDQSSETDDQQSTRLRYKLSVYPASLAFSNTAVNVTSMAGTALLVSRGFAPVTITAMTAVGDYAIVPNALTFPLQIQPDDIVPVQITFTPKATGARTGGLYVNTGDAAGDEFLPFSGSGV